MHRATLWAGSLFISSVLFVVPSFASAATFTALQVDSASATYGGTVTLTATLTNASTHTGISGKTVDFTIFAVPVGHATTDVNGVATLTGVPVSTLIQVGTHNLYIGAAYLGGGGFIGSVSTAALTVTQQPLTVTGITASDKVWDGTTVATINASGAALVGVIAPDHITLNTASATGAFSDPNVGTGKTVQIAGLTISGSHASDYSLTQPTATASITGTAQTLSFNPPLADVDFGSPAPTLGVNTPSTGPTSFMAFGACDYAGSFLQLLGIGNCAVVAANPGDNEYGAATTTGSFNVNPSTQIVYNALPSAFPGNVVSEGFESDSISQFGDYVHLDNTNTNRLLNTVTVLMSNWALQTDSESTIFCSANPSDCSSAGYVWPITINIYNNHLNANGTPDELIATKTEDINIPWRPAGDPTCPDTGYGAGFAWRSPIDGNCYNGLAFNATFDLSNLGVVLPNDVIASIAFNTEDYGAVPTNAAGPYDSLNIGLNTNQTVSVGSDNNVDAVFLDSTWSGAYSSVGTTGIFRQDTGWTPYGTVNMEITASPVAQHSTTTIVTAATLDPAANGGPVSPASVVTDGLNDWFMYNDTNDTVDNTLGTFVAGPATPPNGSGSVQFTLGATPLDRQNIATYQFSGTPLSDITAMSYTAYSHSGVAGATESPYLNFNIDFTGTSGSFQKRLVWVPSVNGAVPSVNGAVPQDNWNTFDTINGGNGMWEYSGTNWPATLVGPDAGLTTSGLTPRTWSAVLADYPAARLLPVGGWLGIRVGEPGPTSYTANIDNFTIGIRNGADATTTAYDFEQVVLPAPTPVSPANGTITTTAAQQLIDWTDVTDGLNPITYVYQASTDGLTNLDGSFTNPVYTSGPLSVSQIGTGGTPPGTYYWHVYAQDSMGYKSAWSVTQSLTVDNTPSVTTVAANPVNTNDATLNATDGLIDADNTSFWWGTTPVGSFTASATPGSELPSGWNHDSGLGTTSASSSFDESVTGLTSGTTYYFAAWVEVSGTWYPGTVLSFTTGGVAPVASVTTDAASSIDLTDATLNGQNGAIASDETSFWWGTTPETSFTSAADPSSEFPASGWSHDPGLPGVGVNGSFDEPLTGLLGNTQYYFAAWSHVGGVWYPGQVLTFTTAAPVPSVTTVTADTVTASDANLNATNGPVDAQGHSFWISTAPFATTSPSIPSGVYSTPDMGTISANSNFTATLSSVTNDGVPSDLPAIQPSTTYYYVAWVNVGGTWYPGTELSFTTASGPSVPVPGVTTEAASNVSDSDATLNGLNGGVDAQNESFWVSTSTIDTSSPTIPDGVYSTPVLPGVASSTSFTDQLALVTTQGITANGNVNMPAITPDTTYHYVAWAYVNGNWYPGADVSFMTTSAPAVPPTANDDATTTNMNTPIIIDVLGNDLNATDLLSFTQPTNGQVATSGTEILYTPSTDYAGTDSFTYIASGPGGDSSSATVTVTVKDTTVPVLTVNGNNPAYVETGDTYVDQGVTVTDTPTNSIGYSVTLDGVATTTDFTLDTSTSGTHTVVYSATDGGGNTGMATRTVEVLDAPTVTLTSTSTSPTTDNPIHVVADFSEPVSAFDETDIDLSSDSLENFAQASSTEYSFDLIPNGANISATIDQHKFTNLAGGENQTGATIAFVYSPLVAPSNNSNVQSGGGGSGNGSPVCGTGDLNCNGAVNIQDLNILLSDWGDTGTNLAADLNHDGKVDFPDIAILLGHWTH